MLCNVRLTILSLLILLSGTALAQWVVDPALNLPLGDGDGDQVVPHIAINSDTG